MAAAVPSSSSAVASDTPPALGQEQQRYRISLWHALIAVQQAHFGHASQDVKLALCRRMAAAYGSELQAHHDARMTKVLGRRLDFLFLERFFRCIVNVLAQQQHHLDFVLEGAEEEDSEAADPSAAAAGEPEPRAQALSIVMASNTVMLEFSFTPKLNDSLQPEAGDLMAAYTCPIQVSVEVDSEAEADQAQAAFLCERIQTCLGQQDFGLLQMVVANFFEQKLVAELANPDAAAAPQDDSVRMVDDVAPAGQPKTDGAPFVSAAAIREALAGDPVLAGCPELHLLQPPAADPAEGPGAAQPELVFARSRLPWAAYDFVVQATSRRSLQFWPPLVLCSQTLAMGLGRSCAAAVARVPPPFDLDFSGVSRRPALSSRALGPECFSVCAPHPGLGTTGSQFVRDCSGSDLASGVVLGFFARDTWFSQVECVERLEFPANTPLPAGWFPNLIRSLRRQLTFNALVQPMFRSPTAEHSPDWPSLLVARGAPDPAWSFSLSAQPPCCVLVAVRQASTGRRWVCEFRILDEPSVAPGGGGGGAAPALPGLQLVAAQTLRPNPFAGSLCNRVTVRISGYLQAAAAAADAGSPADDRLSELAERVLAVTHSLPQTLKQVFVLGPLSRTDGK